jgi:endonuclease/exonuclease/phosphatase family metal-dependent hydrolase
MRSILVFIALCVGLALAFVARSAAARSNRPPARDAALEVRPRDDRATMAPARLRVVTYNVHGIDGAAIASALAAQSETAAAEVYLLQEVERRRGERTSRACVAAERMGLHCVYAPGHELGDGGDLGVAILSTTRLTELEIIELPYLSTVVNSGRRVALGATVRTQAGPVRLLAVHLDNRIGPADRVRQLRPVLDAADRAGLPTVIAGDVNTSPFEFIGHIVPVPTGRQARTLEASVRARGFDTPAVGVGPTSRYLWMRLDAIYGRGVTVTDAAVARATDASDHLPLWADVVVGSD